MNITLVCPLRIYIIFKVCLVITATVGKKDSQMDTVPEHVALLYWITTFNFGCLIDPHLIGTNLLTEELLLLTELLK